jgi:phage-related protein
MNYFIFNGISSAEMGVRIQSKNTYSAPKYDVSTLSIPGRDGELIVQSGRFPNVTLSYTCYVPAKSIQELADKLTAIKAWLYTSTNEYHELKDSYDTKFFRKAAFHSKLDITDQCLKIGTFTATFNCLPFRYSYDGQQSKTYTQSFTLTNPYPFVAKPYIKLNGRGTGTLTIQSESSNKIWQFETLNGYTECDSEQMNFYHDTVLKNDTVSGDGFPVLNPGTNTVSFDGGITSIEILPRWRCL